MVYIICIARAACYFTLATEATESCIVNHTFVFEIVLNVITTRYYLFINKAFRIQFNKFIKSRPKHYLKISLNL